MSAPKPETSLDNLSLLDVRLGEIKHAESVVGSDKLIRLEVDFGPEVGMRQILSGIATWYDPQDLIGKKTTFIINLPYRKMMGMESQGMLLALKPIEGSGEDKESLPKAVFLQSELSEKMPLGSVLM